MRVRPTLQIIDLTGPNGLFDRWPPARSAIDGTLGNNAVAVTACPTYVRLRRTTQLNALDALLGDQYVKRAERNWPRLPADLSVSRDGEGRE